MTKQEFLKILAEQPKGALVWRNDEISWLAARNFQEFYRIKKTLEGGVWVKIMNAVGETKQILDFDPVEAGQHFNFPSE